MKWFLRLLLEGDELIRVKSWVPYWGRYGLEWPTMLVDTRSGQRSTVSPVWDKARFSELANKLRMRRKRE